MLFMKSKMSEAIVAAVVARLKEARKEKEWSHDALARKTGLHRSAISLIESGKRQPTLLTCEKIAQALGISLGRIIAEAEDAARNP
jgi:transcriptional regulator with XRE-family HTH domain